jgi:hypothetical protein
LEYDYKNIVNSMKLLNEAKDLKNLEIVTRREAELLLETWMDPSFIFKMKAYMK